MESRRRKAILWILCAGLALGLMVPLRASGTGPDFAVLKRIGSRVNDRAGVISIEASDPVAYVASQPDPNTFVVESALRMRAPSTARWSRASASICRGQSGRGSAARAT